MNAQDTAFSTRISRLRLADFRNYRALDLHAEKPFLLLVGPNGAGKTNVLEAISLFSPGSGLRTASPAEMARHGTEGSFAVVADILTQHGEVKIGTGISPSTSPEEKSSRRKLRVNGTPQSFSILNEWLHVMWLTPQMDGLFIGSKGDRRRFFDHFVRAIDAGHGSRLNELDRALANRNKALVTGADSLYLDAIEQTLAEIATAIACSRVNMITELDIFISVQEKICADFPVAHLSMQGTLENLLEVKTAAQIEDHYRAILRDNRVQDQAAGRTTVGPHRSDVEVIFVEKKQAAARCSTGEQKALLFGIILAKLQFLTVQTGQVPVFLLDEIAAHLDRERRTRLFEFLHSISGQVWLTGTDISLFEMDEELLQVIEVQNGRVLRV